MLPLVDFATVRTRARAAVLVAVGLLVTCSCGDDAEPLRDVSSTNSGYVLPPSSPDECRVAAGNFVRKDLPEGYGAVVSPKSDERDRLHTSVLVAAERAAMDREVAPNEERAITKEQVAGRTVRLSREGADSSFDWFESGWSVAVRFPSDDRALAEEVVAGLELPTSDSASDIDLTPPADATVQAEISARPTPDSSQLTASQCKHEGRADPDAVVFVSFFPESVDPLALLSIPGPAQEHKLDGQVYWVSESNEQIVWKEGNAIVSVSSTSSRQPLPEFVSKFRRVDRDEVVEWLKASER